MVFKYKEEIYDIEVLRADGGKRGDNQFCRAYIDGACPIFNALSKKDLITYYLELTEKYNSLENEFNEQGMHVLDDAKIYGVDKNWVPDLHFGKMIEVY